MNKITIQKIISSILLPLAILLSLNVLSGLVMAISNPLLLFAHFVIACVPIYIFTSSYFLFQGISKEKKCKPTLKDWIKINALISILFVVIILISSISVFMILQSPQLTQEVFSKIPAGQFPGGIISQQELISLLKMFVYVMLPFSILLLVHIILTFSLIRKYTSLFM